MRTRYIYLSLLILAMLFLGCTSLIPTSLGGKNITPSDVIITDKRDVGAFTGIDMRGFGKMVLTQGDTQSVTISGSDNVVPLVKTTVQDGTLIIELQEKVNVLNLDKQNILTFDITVKDLTTLTVSGAAQVEMAALNTSALTMTMSGAGQFVLSKLAATSADIRLTGLGDIEVIGEVTRETVTISGAGDVRAGDLKSKTADVSITGLGGATVWATDQLNGTISGAGSVSYYGEPKTNVKTTGAGQFKPLGSK